MAAPLQAAYWKILSVKHWVFKIPTFDKEILGRSILIYSRQQDLVLVRIYTLNEAAKKMWGVISRVVQTFLWHASLLNSSVSYAKYVGFPQQRWAAMLAGEKMTWWLSCGADAQGQSTAQLPCPLLFFFFVMPLPRIPTPFGFFGVGSSTWACGGGLIFFIFFSWSPIY